MISHATSLLLWVTSVLLRVVLCLLKAAAGPADGRGVVCLLVGYRAVGACSSTDVCVLLALMIHLGYISLRKYVGQTEDIRDHQLVLTIQ